jgi:membrane associated rhomboid family serine protease
VSNYYRPGGIGFSFFPPVIKNLLIINGVVFVFQLLMQGITFHGVPGAYILDHWFALNPIGHNFQVWQLITYQFMHGGFMHILLNMFALWMFGIEIENMWGSKKFLIYYLMCGVAAGISQLIFPPLFNEPTAPTIGASGAIFGVLIAFGMIFPNRYIFLYFFIPIKAKYLILGFILLELYSVPQGGNVAHLAHLGGALAGFIYILLDKNTDTALRNIFRTKSFKIKKPYNPFGGISDAFKHKKEDVQEAKFYEIKDEDKQGKKDEISQEQIDKILDKISQSGYQNLTEKEKKILFEASKRMK